MILHVDRMLLARSKSNLAAEHMKILGGVCGSVCPLTVTQGKHHEYSGITLNFAAIRNTCTVA